MRHELGARELLLLARRPQAGARDSGVGARRHDARLELPARLAELGVEARERRLAGVEQRQPQGERRAGDLRPIALVLALDADLERHGQEARLPLGRDRVLEGLDGEPRRLEIEPPRSRAIDLGERRILLRQRRERRRRPARGVAQTEQALHRLAVRRRIELRAHALGPAFGRCGARLRALELAEVAGREQRLCELRRCLLRRRRLAQAIGHGARRLRAREGGARFGDEVEHRLADLELRLLHRGLGDALAERHDQDVEQLESDVPRRLVGVAAAAQPAAAERQPGDARRLGEIGLRDAGALERGAELGIAFDRDRDRGVGVERPGEQRLHRIGRRRAGLGVDPPDHHWRAAGTGEHPGIVQGLVGVGGGATRRHADQDEGRQQTRGTDPGVFGHWQHRSLQRWMRSRLESNDTRGHAARGELARSAHGMERGRRIAVRGRAREGALLRGGCGRASGRRGRPLPAPRR